MAQARPGLWPGSAAFDDLLDGLDLLDVLDLLDFFLFFTAIEVMVGYGRQPLRAYWKPLARTPAGGYRKVVCTPLRRGGPCFLVRFKHQYF